jgi:hypothetical protein
MKQIATALVKAQSEMVTPKKANTNPFYKNKYADINSILDAVVPTLNANGIVVLQPHVHIDGKNFVKTILLHESGEMLEGFTEIIYSKNNDAQAQGSGITYARRYGLQSMVSVGADDDDGNKASQEVKIDIPRLETRLRACTTVEELEKTYKSFTDAEQKASAKITTELKLTLTNGSK